MMAEQQSAPSFVSLAIHWIVVPLILLTVLGYGCTLPRRSDDPSVRTSGKAGVVAGFIVFIIFVVSQQKNGLRFSLEVPAYSFDFFGISATVGGVISGFLIARIVDATRQYRAFGFLVLFIVATTTIASYGYFFIKDVRSIVVFVSLGTMLGALLHIICFPEAMTKYRLTADRDEQPPLAVRRPKS
jgi:membrane protein YdbS with pleckstrin-like domain